MATRKISKQKQKQQRASATRNVRQPLARGSVVTNRGQQVIHTANGVKAKGIEQMFSLVTDGTANEQIFVTNINPASSDFEFLSGVAQSYDFYEVHRLTFKYIPQSATTINGRIALAFEYDVYDSGPTTLKEMSAMYKSCSAPVWNECSMEVDVSRLKARGPRFFCSDGNYHGDLRDYIIGALNMGIVSDAGANVELGAVWMEYDISFSVPQPKSHNLDIAAGNIAEYTLDDADTLITGVPYVLGSGTGKWAGRSYNTSTGMVLNGFPSVAGTFKLRLGTYLVFFHTTVVFSGWVTSSVVDLKMDLLVNGSTIVQTHDDEEYGSTFSTTTLSQSAQGLIKIDDESKDDVQLSALTTYGTGISAASIQGDNFGKGVTSITFMRV